MLHSWTEIETVRQQTSSRTPVKDDQPLVVLIDPRILLGQCTASGLQDIDPGLRYGSFRTVAEWLDAQCGPTALLLLCAPSPDLDRDIATVTSCDAHPRFAVLADAADDAEIRRYLRMGARGYIAISRPRVDVCEALRSIVSGEIVVAASDASPRALHSSNRRRSRDAVQESVTTIGKDDPRGGAPAGAR